MNLIIPGDFLQICCDFSVINLFFFLGTVLLHPKISWWPNRAFRHGHLEPSKCFHWLQQKHPGVGGSSGAPTICWSRLTCQGQCHTQSLDEMGGEQGAFLTRLLSDFLLCFPEENSMQMLHVPAWIQPCFPFFWSLEFWQTSWPWLLKGNSPQGFGPWAFFDGHSGLRQIPVRLLLATLSCSSTLPPVAPQWRQGELWLGIEPG